MFTGAATALLLRRAAARRDTGRGLAWPGSGFGGAPRPRERGGLQNRRGNIGRCVRQAALGAARALCSAAAGPDGASGGLPAGDHARASVGGGCGGAALVPTPQLAMDIDGGSESAASMDAMLVDETAPFGAGCIGLADACQAWSVHSPILCLPVRTTYAPGPGPLAVCDACRIVN